MSNLFPHIVINASGAVTAGSLAYSTVALGSTSISTAALLAGAGYCLFTSIHAVVANLVSERRQMEAACILQVEIEKLHSTVFQLEQQLEIAQDGPDWGEELRLLNTLLKRMQAQPKKSTEPVTVLPDEEPKETQDAEIRRAILANRIDLYVQPTMRLPSRKPAFYECLSRLRDEAGKVIYPSAFLELAQQSNLIGTLDNFLLLRCVQIARRLRRQAPKQAFFCNLSAASLKDPEFYDQFIDFMSSDSSLAEHLVFEFEADDWNDWPAHIASGLSDLVQARFRFCCDNADGTEDLQTLKTRGVAFVKIPARVLLDPSTRPEIERYRSQAESLGIAVIATQVEDDKTLIELNDRGFEYGQGYLLASPESWEKVEESERAARRSAA